MTGTSTSDAIACVLLAVGLFATSLVPFFLLVDVDRLTPQFVSEAPAAVRAVSERAALSAVGLLLLLTLKGDRR